MCWQLVVVRGCSTGPCVDCRFAVALIIFEVVFPGNQEGMQKSDECTLVSFLHAVHPKDGVENAAAPMFAKQYGTCLFLRARATYPAGTAGQPGLCSYIREHLHKRSRKVVLQVQVDFGLAARQRLPHA